MGTCFYAWFFFTWAYRFAWEGSWEFFYFCCFYVGGSFLLTQCEVSGLCDPVLIVEAIDPLGHNVDGGLALFSLVHLSPFEFLGFIFIFVSISLT